MKKLLITALVGLSSVALFVSSANAAIPGNPGDLIVGFYATSGTGAGTNVELDLGPVTKFLNATPNETFSLNGSSGLVAADLAATYGTNWATDTNLYWGAVATNQATTGSIDSLPNYSLLATGPVNAGYLVGNRPQQQGPSGFIASTYTGIAAATGTELSTNSSVTAFIPASQGDSYVTADLQGSTGQSFGYFTPIVDNQVTNTNPWDFYELATVAIGQPNKPATLLGAFTLSSNGTFTYKAAAVPEPSKMGLTGVGFLSLIGLLALRRRRSILA